VPILRISHAGSHVEATFERQSEKRPFSFVLSAQDAEDIRWYLEDYRVYPVDPAPMIAKRIEQRMAEAGRELFRQVLAGSDVWASMGPTPTSRSPARTTNSDVRKNGIALTPAIRICVQRDVPEN
jgi:hypothetical protein